MMLAHLVLKAVPPFLDRGHPQADLIELVGERYGRVGGRVGQLSQWKECRSARSKPSRSRLRNL